VLAVARNPAAHCRTSDLRAGLIVRTTNDASGEYVLATLPRGTSWIVVTGAGPARSVQRITVRVGQNDSLNLTLNEQPLALEAVVIASTRDNRSA
jgi:Carboxypeptidase regulatory-like domain